MPGHPYLLIQIASGHEILTNQAPTGPLTNRRSRPMKHISSRSAILCLLLGTCLLLPGPLLAEPTTSTEWTQWRGPQRDGTSVGEPWPEDLKGLEKVWEQKLGPSYSGPIVAADRVFVTETEGGKTEVVRALDRTTGKELWRASWPGEGSVPPFARANGDWIRSTPSYDGNSLFVGGMNEVLVALDTANGDVRWTLNFPATYKTPVPPFGFSSSPLVLDDHLYIQAANSLVKLNKADGKVVWRTLEETGGMANQGAFSSPVLATLHGREQLVVLSRSTLHGVDPESGETLWSQEVPAFRGCNILTPAVHGNAVFTSGYQNGSRLYAINSGDQGFSVQEAWTGKASGYMSSPVIIDGHVYLHLGNGRLTCLDLETGATRWTSTPFGKYWSMAVRGNKILALDERGDLVLVRANPEELEVLDTRSVSESDAWAYLAVSGEEVFVRGLDSVAAYRWQGAHRNEGE